MYRKADDDAWSTVSSGTVTVNEDASVQIIAEEIVNIADIDATVSFVFFKKKKKNDERRDASSNPFYLHSERSLRTGPLHCQARQRQRRLCP